jgi:uncharacterized membrane protein
MSALWPAAAGTSPSTSKGGPVGPAFFIAGGAILLLVIVVVGWNILRRRR